VCGDILSMLDTDLSKSLNVLTFVTPSNMPIHPSIFFIIRLTALYSVNVRSHLMLRFRHLLIKSVFTLERSKEETQEKSQDQTLRAEAVQSLYNKNCVNAKPVF
jgi:hypothetical protein